MSHLSRRDQRAASAQQLMELLQPLASGDRQEDAEQKEARSHQAAAVPDILAAVQALIPTLDLDSPLFAAFHDGQVQDPLGGGAYAFQSDLIGPVLLALANDEALPRSQSKAAAPTRPIVIHAGAQPNNSPHAGTLVVFCYAFSLARALQDRLRSHHPLTEPAPPVSVEITFVDTAPVQGEGVSLDSVQYQRSYRDVPSALAAKLADYFEVFRLLSTWSGILFKTTFQADFFADPVLPSLISYIASHRARLETQLSPKHHALAIRAACPAEGCALAEKHGRLNQYSPSHITFSCPRHGPHSIDLSRPDEVARLEANAPARNLIRSMSHLLDETRHHIRVTGADYAGTYQEAFLYRPLAEWSASTGLASGRTPHILYAPQVVDWSGAKLSKNLYVREGAYKAMEVLGTDGLGSYERLKAQLGTRGLQRIWNEVESWVAEPRKLFRAAFSIDYMKRVLDGQGGT